MDNQNQNGVEPTNFVAPQQTITGSFIAPSNSFSSREKNPNTELLPIGAHPAIIYGVVDMGTQEATFSGTTTIRRVVRILFEYPQLRQRFFIDSDEELPTVTSVTTSLNLHGDNSKLRQIVSSVLGKELSNQEKDTFDLAKLLGAKLVTNINHAVAKKTGNTYEKVTGFSFLNPKTIIIPENFEPVNQRLLFFIDNEGKNFQSKNFADLYFWLKQEIYKSEEAKSYISKGGAFAQNEDSKSNQGSFVASSAPSGLPSPSVAPVAQKSNLVMLVSDFTYEQYIASGWTDDDLVLHGKAKSVQPAAPAPSAPAPAPAPSAPSAPSAPAAAPSGNYQPSLEEDDDDLPF